MLMEKEYVTPTGFEEEPLFLDDDDDAEFCISEEGLQYSDYEAAVYDDYYDDEDMEGF